MNEPRILISRNYLELLGQAIGPEIIEIHSFADFLNNLKYRLRGQGKEEVFKDIIREEIHMLEKLDKFV